MNASMPVSIGRTLSNGESDRTVWTPAQIEATICEFAASLSLVTAEDPRVFDAQFHDRLARLNAMSLSCPEQRHRLMAFCFQACAKELDRGVIHAHCRTKPLGYSGDHLLIDWFYSGRTGSAGMGQHWDQFSYRQVIAQSLRYRKIFLGEVLSDLCHKARHGLSVLVLACGGCRDVAHAIVRCGARIAGSFLHCVDADERAISYAAPIFQKLTSNHPVCLEAADPFRLRPTRRYDLVWCASRFDTLDERSAILLLKRMWSWTRPGGQIILGQCHPRHPDRNYLEWCLDWRLTYRTEIDLWRLCMQAGIPGECVTVDEEPLGVSQFCIVTRPTWLSL
jgi:extracellular factor (EF) 3-hydroxypalmitic acid methyl ester biosynthesis protein